MIVSNSSPLIHLSRIGWLTLLKKVFERVIIPRTVFQEVVIKGEEKGYLDAKLIRKATEEWIEVKELEEDQKKECDLILKMAPIGHAEAEAIVLAKAMNLPILVDDLIAQRVAKSYGIETYWTTSVVLGAWKENIISKDRTRKIIEDLIKSGLRIKPEVVLELMKKLN
jgi:predicted nucleic acid-binding protein